MNILLAAERYWPSIGGVQTVTRLLGCAFQHVGHNVTVVTNEQTCAPGSHTVHRVAHRPNALALFRLYNSSQIVIVQGSVVRLSWPLLAVRRPALMVHHMIPCPPKNRTEQFFRAQLAARVRHATVSLSMSRMLPYDVQAVLPNPYDSSVFQRSNNIQRSKDVVLVGRLIREKGAHILVETLGILQLAKRRISATIVGAGPERGPLEELAQMRGVASQVRFVGAVTGVSLSRLLQEHRVLVVPSLNQEAFGVVALEGAACGCIVVASNIGGLPEAVGNSGVLFRVGDAASLACRLSQVLGCESLNQVLRRKSIIHLKNHLPASVANTYLNWFEQNKANHNFNQ